MKYLYSLAVVLYLFGCLTSDKQLNDLREENGVLKMRIDSLSNELNDIKFGSKNLFQQAKTAIANKNFVVTKQLLTTLINKYPFSIEYNPAKTLLIYVAPKAEEQLFRAASKSEDIRVLRTYINEYPRGKYHSIAIKLIKQYQKRQSVQAHNTYVAKDRNLSKKTGRQVKPGHEPSSVRVGAICCDGTRSYATGRGACSHHGGVCQWLYQ